MWVHSYHINIAQGDAAIHLLVDKNTTGIWRIQRAILIDGGEQQTAVARRIKDIISFIRGNYDCTAQTYLGDQTTMRFDAIVITHWDADHWGGIRQLLEDDYNQQLTALVTPLITQSETAYQTAITAALGASPHSDDVNQFVQRNPDLKTQWNQVAQAYRNVALESSYMKYSATTAYPATTALQTTTTVLPVVPPASLQTIFYGPYMNGTQNLGTDSTAGLLTTSFFRANFNQDYVSYVPTEGGAVPSATRATNTLSVMLGARYEMAIPTPVPTTSGWSTKAKAQVTEVSMIWNVVNVCRLIANHNEYLGIELFTGQQCPGRWRDMTSPTVLATNALADNTRFGASRLGMFVVSGDQYVIGAKQLVQADQPPAGWPGVKPPPMLLRRPHDPSPVVPETAITHSRLVDDNEQHGRASEKPNSGPVDKSLSVRPVRIINSGLSGRFAGNSAQRTSSDDKNSPSIGCVVLVATGTANPPTAVNILHYTAGDALYDTEGALQQWMSTDATVDGGGMRIPLMKLSHHGAARSSPSSLLRLLTPRIIVNSNDDGGTFGHPRPEVLCYLLALIALLRKFDMSNNRLDYWPLRLACTNYPSWMNPKWLNRGGTLGLSAFTPLNLQNNWPEYRAYSEVLSMFTQSQYSYDIVDRLARIQFQNSGGDHDNTNTTALAIEMTHEWGRISPGAPGGLTDKIAAHYFVLNPDSTVADRWIDGAGSDWETANVRLKRKTFTLGRVRQELENAQLAQANALAAARQAMNNEARDQRAKRGRGTGNDDLFKPTRFSDDAPVATPYVSKTDTQKGLAASKVSDLDEEGGYTVLDAGSGGLDAQEQPKATLVLQKNEQLTGQHGQSKADLPSSQKDTASTGTNFYICGSAIVLPSDTGCYSLNLDTCNPFDLFLSVMDNPYLTLDSTLGTTPAIVSNGDRWMQYLLNNSLGVTDSLGITQMRILGSVTGQVADITSVEVDFKLTNLVTLNFSTAATGNVMSASGPKSSPTAFSDVFSPGQNLLVLGLTNSALSFTTTDLLDALAPPWLSSTSGLPGFGLDLSFTLDQTIGSRSGLFLSPLPGHPAWLRLRFKITSDDSCLTSAMPFLAKSSKISFSNTYFHVMASAYSELIGENFLGNCGHSFMLQTAITISGGPSFGLWLKIESTITTLVLTFDESATFDSIFNYLLEEFMPGIESPAGLPEMGNNLRIHQVSVTMDNPSPTTKFGFESISLTLQADAFGSVFSATFTWPKFAIKATIWDLADSSLTDDDNYLVPDFEIYQSLAPFNITGGNSVSGNAPLLGSVVPGSSNPAPQSIGTHIVDVEFDAWKDESGLNLIFQGTISTGGPPPSDVPTLELGDLTVYASRTPGSGSDASATYDVKLATTIYLFPRDFTVDAPEFSPARLDVSVEYDSGDWTVNALATNLQFAVLFDMFDSDAQHSVMDILEQISIPYIQCMWDYDLGVSHLHVEGALLVHTLELKLAYDYVSSPNSWTFQAQLGVVANSTDPSSQIKILDLIKSFESDPNSQLVSLLNEVPFIGEIAIPSVNTTPGSFEDAPIQLEIQNTGDATVMWFQLEIDSPDGDLSLLFVQHQPHSKSASKVKPKRILRVRIDKLPSIPSIPVVGSINNPVDSVEYVLVMDATGGTTAGINMAEMTAINSALNTNNKIRYRDVKSDIPPQSSGSSQVPTIKDKAADSADKDNYVLLQGHHFIVVANNAVVLDHIFGSSTPATAPPQKTITHQSSLPTKGAVPTGNDSATDADSGPTVGPVSKKVGPLSITNFGLQSKDEHLWILLDATIALGPIILTLIGFGVGIPLTINGAPISFNNLKDISPSSFDLQLTGMSVYFNQPPVLIAGFFEKISTAAFESFVGGLAVSILPYTVLCVGAYTHTLSPDFKSVFNFGRLDGPILTLEFAEIRGIEIGWGENYDLTLPTVPDINNFPLVHGASASNNPMTLMETNSDGTAPVTSFAYWTKPRDGSGWFAIGMTVDSCQIITIQAAAIIVFGPMNFKVAIVGMASGSLPPNESGGKPPDSLLYVEFGVIAALDLFGGSVWAGAQLTPNSYVLCPDCHLTGGFALAYWFWPSPTAGDFVFTVGGYASSYNVPAHYPACDRVGIYWNIEDCITVTGGAYLAVTPKETMAGGRLEFVFDASPFYASFTAWADFMIIYRPLFMTAEIGCSIEAGFEGSIGLIHFHIHISLDADLYLQGPPWSGRLHIDLCIASFNVNFGDQNDSPPPLHWDDPDAKKSFLKLVQQPGPGSPDKAAMCVVAIEEGSVNEKTTDADRQTGDVWFVRAGTFQFRLEAKIPVNSMNYDDGHDNTRKFGVQGATPATTTIGVPGTNNPVYALPMQLNQELTSTLTFTITTSDPLSDPRAKIVNPWLYSPLQRNVPRALWDISGGSPPVYSGGSTDTTITHVIGYTFLTPNPRTPETPATAFTFNAALAMSEGVFPDGVGYARKDRNPLFKDSTPDQRPVLHPTPPVQTTDLPLTMIRDSATDDEWSTVSSAWKAADKVVGQKFAEIWSQRMGWGKDAPLVAKRPEALLAEFETFYLGCPWLTNAPPA